MIAHRTTMRLQLCAIAIVVAATATPVAAQTQNVDIDFSRIGHRATAEILGYRTGDHCDQQSPASDCTFTSPLGVEYVVFDGYICGINAAHDQLTKNVRLPYGLLFGDPKSVAAAKLDSQQTDLPMARRVGGGWGQSEGREFYASVAGFFGDPDMLTGLHLWFDTSGRLTEVSSHATCV